MSLADCTSADWNKADKDLQESRAKNGGTFWPPHLNIPEPTRETLALSYARMRVEKAILTSADWNKADKDLQESRAENGGTFWPPHLGIPEPTRETLALSYARMRVKKAMQKLIV